MVNIVIPMAGKGKRFSDAGYIKPKPFIDVLGKPMIERVINNLNYPNARYILIARNEHLIEEKEVVDYLKNNYNVIFIPIENITEGAVCTTLYAYDYINNDDSLLIANSDQIIDMSLEHFIENCLNRNLDGSILTFISSDLNKKWSYAKIDENGLVIKTEEKNPISKYATSGLYFFRKGSDYIEASIKMFIQNERVNGEFYVCPVYNHIIKKGKNIGIFNISEEQMCGIGTPEDLKIFLSRGFF